MRKLAFGIAAASTLLVAAPAWAQYFEFGIGPRGPSFHASPGYPYYYSGYPSYYAVPYARPYQYYGDSYYDYD